MITHFIVSTENGGEYHGEAHYITCTSNLYNSYSLQILRTVLRLIITFHFEVSGEQLHTSISTWTCKFTVRILPIYKVCPQTYLRIYLHLRMIQFKHVWGPTILLGLPVCCCHGNPCTLSNSFMLSYSGTFIVQVIAHNLKKIWWYLNIAEVYYLLYCIRNYLNYKYKYWDM